MGISSIVTRLARVRPLYPLKCLPYNYGDSGRGAILLQWQLVGKRLRMHKCLNVHDFAMGFLTRALFSSILALAWEKNEKSQHRVAVCHVIRNNILPLGKYIHTNSICLNHSQSQCERMCTSSHANHIKSAGRQQKEGGRSRGIDLYNKPGIQNWNKWGWSSALKSNFGKKSKGTFVNYSKYLTLQYSVVPFSIVLEPKEHSSHNMLLFGSH